MSRTLIEISNFPNSHHIFKISDPYKLRERANELGFVELIYLSTHINKKYVVKHPFAGRLIYFGSVSMKFISSIIIKSEKNVFINHNSANAKQYYPAYLSHFLLW